MAIRAWLAVAVVVATLICAAGCTGPFLGVGGPVKNCGTENYGRGDGYDADMRDCVWQGYTSGHPVVFTTAPFTTEGDPIYTKVEFVGSERVTVRVDTTHDHFGPHKITQYTCTKLDRRTANWGGHEQVKFMVSGCTGGDTAQVGF